MTWKEKQLEKRTQDLKEIYSPNFAFGNTAIIDLLNQIREDADYLESHQKCRECEGEGSKECSECGHEVECTNCHGEGFTEKP